MLSKVSVRSLSKVAVYGAVGCISLVMYARYSIQERIRVTEFYRESFRILRAHPGAKSLLGEPIKDMGFDLGDESKNLVDERNGSVKMNVAVKGPKARGYMLFWAQKEGEKWQVDRVELEMKEDSSKRLLVKGDKP